MERFLFCVTEVATELFRAFRARDISAAAGFYQHPASPTQRARELEGDMSNTILTTSKKWLGSAALATTVLGGFLLFGGANTAKADDGDGYRFERQVQYTEWRANEAAERFGYRSREAKHWRHENHEARERLEHFRHEYREHHRRYRDYDRDDYRRW